MQRVSRINNLVKFVYLYQKSYNILNRVSSSEEFSEVYCFLPSFPNNWLSAPKMISSDWYLIRKVGILSQNVSIAPEY